MNIQPLPKLGLHLQLSLIILVIGVLYYRGKILALVVFVL